jgi:hypothetical protein
MVNHPLLLPNKPHPKIPPDLKTYLGQDYSTMQQEFNRMKYTFPWCRRQTNVCSRHQSYLMVQYKKGRGRVKWNPGNLIYTGHPFISYTLDTEGKPAWNCGECTPAAAECTLPFTAYGFSQCRDCFVLVPTEPMLHNDSFTSLTGDHKIKWKYKFIGVYNAIVEYYLALHPNKPFSQFENSWIETVFTMARDITNNRSAFNAKESARLDRIKRNSEDFSSW